MDRCFLALLIDAENMGLLYTGSGLTYHSFSLGEKCRPLLHYGTDKCSATTEMYTFLHSLLSTSVMNLDVQALKVDVMCSVPHITLFLSCMIQR